MTASGRNRTSWVDVSVVLIAGALVIATFSLLNWHNSRISRRQMTLGSTSDIFVLEVASTTASREYGLSGRSELKPNSGMLFVFDQPVQACFWMKDMRFDIDILWYDSANHLAYRWDSANPSSYPTSRCSNIPAKYVVEVPAGTADRLGLQIGDELHDVSSGTNK